MAVSASPPAFAPPAPAYPIESVANALELLLLLRSRRSMTVSEGASALGVARSTAHRILAMLVQYGFAAQDARTRAYHAGPAFAAPAVAAAGDGSLELAVQPHLVALAATFGETVHLCALRGRDVIYLRGIESSKALRAGDRTGTVLPAHATSAGKMLLATLSDAEILERYPREELAPVTQRTIETRTSLLRAIRTARKRGFAINNAESERGLTALSCAVFSRTGEARGAIALSGPDARFRSDTRTRMIVALRVACEIASATIR